MITTAAVYTEVSLDTSYDIPTLKTPSSVCIVPYPPIILPGPSMSLASNRADRILRGALYARVRNNLVLVMSHRRLSDRAHIALARLQHVRVVGRQHRGRGAHDGAQRVVELLGFGLLHGRLERGAGGGFGAAQAGDGRVLVQVVVVVGGGAYDGALWWGALACGSGARDGEIVGGSVPFGRPC